MSALPVPEARVHGQGPDIILLHGLFGSGDNFGTQARALGSHFRVHTPDLRNHGSSFHHAQMNYAVMAEDILRYADRTGIAQAVIAGHSMGGKVAMQVALNAPRRFPALIVLDIAPVDYARYGAQGRHDKILQALLTLEEHPVHSRGQADAHLTSFVTDPGVRAFLLKNLRRHPDHTYHLRLNIRAIADSYANLAAAPQGTPYPGPALFLKGGQSGYIRDEFLPGITRMFPSARIHVLPEAGHWLHTDCPEETIAAIRDFLAKHTGKGC